MPKSIDTLVDDIYGLFSGGLTFNPALFESFGANLQAGMETRFNTERDGTPRLRMSNIGRPNRQLWYELNSKAMKEDLPPWVYVKFAYGDMIEQLVLLYAKMAGHDVEREQESVLLDGIKGSIDCVIDGVLIDVKSASSFSFDKFANGDIFKPGNDPFGYTGQLCGYLKATGLTRGGFLVVDKTLGKVVFCEIPPEVIEAYDVRTRIDEIKAVVAAPSPPARCYDDVPDGKSGNRKLSTGCSYCPFKNECWPNLQVFYYSTGPRYLTQVVRVPKVSNDFDGM